MVGSELPGNVDYQGITAALATDLGMLEAGERDRGEGLRLCRTAVARLDRLAEPGPESHYLKARAFAQIGSAGTTSPSLPADAPADRPSSPFETAVALLSRAFSSGYRDREWIAIDPALDGLRSRRDFRLLMMDLAMPDDPFSRAD